MAPANARNAAPDPDRLMPPVAAYTAGQQALGVAILMLALTGVGAVVSTIRRPHVTRRRTSSPQPAAAPPSPTIPEILPAGETLEPAPAKTPTLSVTPAVAPAPRVPDRRLERDTFGTLAVHLQASRELQIVEERIAQTLSVLPTDRWEWQRHVHADGRLWPFVIFGETGVFAVWGAIGPLRWDQLAHVGNQTNYLKQLLAGYPGPVHAAFCRGLYRGELASRWWCRPGEPGAWVMSLSALTGWIEHFGTENGIGVGDVNQLRQLRSLIAQGGPTPRHPDLVADL